MGNIFNWGAAKEPEPFPFLNEIEKFMEDAWKEYEQAMWELYYLEKGSFFELKNSGDHLYDREGNPYGGSSKKYFHDYGLQWTSYTLLDKGLLEQISMALQARKCTHYFGINADDQQGLEPGLWKVAVTAVLFIENEKRKKLNNPLFPGDPLVGWGSHRFHWTIWENDGTGAAKVVKVENDYDGGQSVDGGWHWSFDVVKEHYCNGYCDLKDYVKNYKKNR